MAIATPRSGAGRGEELIGVFQNSGVSATFSLVLVSLDKW